ncbi:MAG: hypothetical protein MMC33_003589 [Icmadophila ericetorum]|nr:hypothetical protein [Icmadophila ericetorum]
MDGDQEAEEEFHGRSSGDNGQEEAWKASGIRTRWKRGTFRGPGRRNARLREGKDTGHTQLNAHAEEEYADDTAATERIRNL